MDAACVHVCLHATYVHAEVHACMPICLQTSCVRAFMQNNLSTCHSCPRDAAFLALPLPTSEQAAPLMQMLSLGATAHSG
eukprot:364501-Chlamydomonas_euryale.AAC.2